VSRLTVLGPREAAIFACLAETVAMPAPPLPPVAATDAVAGFDAWLAAVPAPQRLAQRGALLALGLARLRRRTPARRDALLAGLAGSPVPGVALLLEALRAAAAGCYYGDSEVMRALGYDAAERVSRGRGLRTAEGRS
jgi:hypothetical protein